MPVRLWVLAPHAFDALAAARDECHLRTAATR
jgi:hypothetical protein